MDAAGAEGFEGFVGLEEGEGLGGGVDGYAGGQVEEFAAVRAGEVGDGADGSLFPEKVVGEGGDVAHMDAAADDGGAFVGGAQGEGDEGADGGEDDACVERMRGWLGGIPGPGGAEAIDPQMFYVIAGQRVRPVADEAGAKQGRPGGVCVLFRHGEAELFEGEGVFCITAVMGVPCEESTRTTRPTIS